MLGEGTGEGLACSGTSFSAHQGCLSQFAGGQRTGAPRPPMLGGDDQAVVAHYLVAQRCRGFGAFDESELCVASVTMVVTTSLLVAVSSTSVASSPAARCCARSAHQPAGHQMLGDGDLPGTPRSDQADSHDHGRRVSFQRLVQHSLTHADRITPHPPGRAEEGTADGIVAQARGHDRARGGPLERGAASCWSRGSGADPAGVVLQP